MTAHGHRISGATELKLDLVCGNGYKTVNIKMSLNCILTMGGFYGI